MKKYTIKPLEFTESKSGLNTYISATFRAESPLGVYTITEYKNGDYCLSLGMAGMDPVCSTLGKAVSILQNHYIETMKQGLQEVEG